VKLDCLWFSSLKKRRKKLPCCAIFVWAASGTKVNGGTRYFLRPFQTRKEASTKKNENSIHPWTKQNHGRDVRRCSFGVTWRFTWWHSVFRWGRHNGFLTWRSYPHVKFSTRSTGQGTQKKSWKNELHLFLETQCHVPYSTSLPIGWLLKSRLVPVSASRVTHHKLTPSTQWAFYFLPTVRVAPLLWEPQDQIHAWTLMRMCQRQTKLRQVNQRWQLARP
jgi:hypothetical protein